jgi:hypothetical protein
MCVPDVPLHGGMGERTCSTGPVDDDALSTRGYSLAHICSKKCVAVFETSSVLDLVGQKNAFQPECTMNCAKITNTKMYLAAST